MRMVVQRELRAVASIAEEKANGTLGLLMLTPLSGGELLFGKFFSVAIASLPPALAVVPIFGVSLLFGGISGGEFLRLGFALPHCLTLVICIGAIISAHSRDAIVASMGTVGVLFLSLC